MKPTSEYFIVWHNIGKAKDLYSILHEQSVSVSDQLFPILNNPGLYIFLDDDQKVIDVGEANPKRRGLRNRLRNEIYSNSAFSYKLSGFGMKRTAQLELNIKVGIVEQGIDDSESPEEIDKHLRLIESALIHETKPWSLSHGGITNWGKRPNIQIHNKGDYLPLKEVINKSKGEHH